MSDRATLVQIYIAFYDRAPDPEGLAFWQSVCDGGLALSEIAQLFVPQDESIATYPFLGDPTEDGIRSFIADVYENLFNRAPDAAGEAFWTNEILKSLNLVFETDPDVQDESPVGGYGLSIGEVILKIIEGAQGDDITALNNKTTVALDWHDQAALTDGYVQTDEAATASRLALGVVDATDFSVVQGEVLNENFFEDLSEVESGLTPFVPGAFDPIVQPGTVPQSEITANGFLIGDQSNAKVAVLADGKIVIAYDHDITPLDAPRQVAFRILNADGSTSEADRLILSETEIDGGAFADTPSLAALPDGGFILFASVTSPNDDDGLYSYRFDGLGQMVAAPILVVEAGDFNDVAQNPDVTYLPTGDVLYTFTADPEFAGDSDVMTRILTLDGNEVKAAQVINDDPGDGQDQDRSRGATLPDGTNIIVYTDEAAPDGVGDDIVGRLYDAGGTPLDSPFVINEFLTRDQRAVDVSALGDDHFVVVFQTRSSEFDQSREGISAVILDRTGDVEIAEFPVNVIEAFEQFLAKVTELPNGNFVVTWTSAVSSSLEIRARIFDEDGTPVTGDISVNTLEAGTEFDSDIAATQDGFVVTWTTTGDNLDDPSGNSIKLAAFDLDGAPVALPEVSNPNLSSVSVTEFQVNDEIRGTQSDAQVVGLSDGRSVISYLDEPSGDTFFEVRAADGSLLVAEQAAFAGDLDMVATPSGGFAMVGLDPQTGQIRLQIFDSALNDSGIIVVNQTTGTHVDPVVAVNSDTGVLNVSWNETSGAAPLAKARAFDADGTIRTGESTFASGFEIQGITTSSDGTILVVGQTENSFLGFGDNVSVALLAPDFTSVSLKLLPVDTSGVQTDVTAAPLADGNILVVFNSDVTPGDLSLSGLSGIIIDSNGDAVGAEFSVSQSTLGTQTEPDATVLSDGRVLVSWTGDTAGGAGQDIYGRIFNTDGSVATDEFVINPVPEDNQSASSISASGAGFVAAWQASNGKFGDESASSITATIFDADQNPIEVPLVVGNQGLSFISLQDILDLQDTSLPGRSQEVLNPIGSTALGATFFNFLPGEQIVAYDPFIGGSAVQDIPVGEQKQEIFTYTVEDDLGNQVELIGSFIVQGYEDII